MCYDIKTSLKTQLKRAKHYNNEKTIKEIEIKLAPYVQETLFHASGFAHPKLLIYTNETPKLPTIAVWGLIPSWVKDEAQQLKFWNNTLNARGETIFEKPSFKHSAKSKRCLIIVEGFYEHHHFKSKNYPFHIQSKDGEPLVLAGLWNDWTNRDTGEVIRSFTIVTTKGNQLMQKIHNNPKLKEARMPVILHSEAQEEWLTAAEQKEVEALIQPQEDGHLKAHTVAVLRGKNSLGNVPEAAVEKKYNSLDYNKINGVDLFS